VNPCSRYLDGEVKGIIEDLLCRNQFIKSYGPRQLISDLRARNVSENKIPSKKQLQNKLFYFCQTKFMYVNEVHPLEDKLHPLVFIGDEGEEQSFICHYKCDAEDHLILGDGSDL
jgi:hypothetical protein